MSTAPASRFGALPARFLKKTLGVAVLTLLSSTVLAEDLLQIFNVAAESDPVVRQARATYNATHTLLDQGRGLLLPQITATLSTGRNTEGTDGPVAIDPNNPPAFGQRPPHSFGVGYNRRSYGLNLTQNLLNFQAWYTYKSYQKGDEVAALTLAQAEQELIVRVATAYFDVLRAQADLTSLQAEEAASTQLLDQTQQRFDVGLIPITDVYDGQSQADSVTVRRLVAENTLSQRFEALEAITGVDYTTVSALSPEFPITSSDSSMEEWARLTMSTNLALQKAEIDLEAKQHDARAARAAMFPTVSLNMGYTWGQSGGVGFYGTKVPNINTGITLNFSMPLFAGGQNRAAMRRAYFTRDATEEVLLKTRRDSEQAVSNNFRTVETDVRAVAAQERAIISAQSSLEANTVGAEVGTRNIVDVVNAQSNLFARQRDYANARFNYVMDTLRLKQTAGTLSPQDVIDLNEWLVE